MALEGNLKDFALSEILQLISVQQKTGYLKLKTTNDVAEIWFDKGRITYSTRSKTPLEEQIKEHLVKTNKLSKEVIDQIETAAAQSNVNFEKVIVSGGYLSRKELNEISSFLIEEMIHDLFKWQEGRYSFTPKKKHSSSPAQVSLKTEGLLMEGMRRLDEWPAIEELLPSGDLIVKKGDADPDEFSLTDQEIKLIKLAGHEGKSLDELVDVSGLGKYRTYETIVNLMEVDLVETVDLEEKIEEKKRKPSINISKILRPIGAFLGIVIFLAACILFIYGIRMGLDLIGFSTKEASLAEEAKVVQDVENIQTALDIYLIKNAQYPESLNKLVESNLLVKENLYDDVWSIKEGEEGVQYKYDREADGLHYTLQTSKGEFQSK